MLSDSAQYELQQLEKGSHQSLRLTHDRVSNPTLVVLNLFTLRTPSHS